MDKVKSGQAGRQAINSNDSKEGAEEVVEGIKSE